jgi:hypothetical protein
MTDQQVQLTQFPVATRSGCPQLHQGQIHKGQFDSGNESVMS